MTEIVGRASSLILLFTLIRQGYKHWKNGETDGVSHWLFVGQLLSSIGFAACNFPVSNWFLRSRTGF